MLPLPSVRGGQQPQDPGLSPPPKQLQSHPPGWHGARGSRVGSQNLHHSAAVTGSPTTPPPPHHSISVGTLQALLSVVSPFSSPWTDDTRVRSCVISLRFWNILPYSLFSLLFRLIPNVSSSVSLIRSTVISILLLSPSSEFLNLFL